MHLRFFVLGFAASLFVWACASQDPVPTSGSDALTGNGKSSSKDDPSTASKSSSASDAGAASRGASDAGAASRPGSGPATSDPGRIDDPCYDACDQKHAAGAKMLAQLAQQTDNCMCGSGACGSQCAKSFMCSEDDNAPDPSSGCEQCMDTCFNQEDSACNANADCAAVQKCYDACDAQGGSAKSGN